MFRIITGGVFGGLNIIAWLCVIIGLGYAVLGMFNAMGLDLRQFFH